MKLKLSKELFNEAYFPMLFDYSHRWEVYMGSAGSGKSHFIAQKLVLKALKEKRRILVCRRYGSTIKNSVFQLFLDTLRFFKILDKCKVNNTDRVIELPNGSKFIFSGLDNEEKLLSIQNIDTIFVEEVFEVPREIVDQLNLRMRGRAKDQQIYLAFNPVSISSWLYKFVEEEPPESFFKLKTTYKDNRFLPKEYVNALEDMRRTNPNKARVYVDGEWGVDVDAQVFQNWSIEDININELLQNPEVEVRVGTDFGYVDASTIAVTLYDKKNKTIYIIDEYYKRGASLDELANAYYDLGINKQTIYCDSAEPRSIEFLCSQGLRARKGIKGRGSVEAGIAFLQNHTIVVLPKCENMIKELENFVYLKDKDTGLLTNKTDHAYSHLVDALRYAYSNIYTSRKVKSQKLFLGI